MGSLKTLRNIAIVLALGAAVYLLPEGGRAATTFEAALWTAFGIGVAYMGLRLYRERHMWLLSLGERHRALLYGAIALGLFAIASRSRMWQTGTGELFWFVLVAIVVYGLLEVFRHARSY